MTERYLKICGTVGAVGIVVAVVTTILYFMQLPIFSERDIAWTFTGGLVAAAIGVLSIIIRAIWDNEA